MCNIIFLKYIEIYFFLLFLLFCFRLSYSSSVSTSHFPLALNSVLYSCKIIFVIIIIVFSSRLFLAKVQARGGGAVRGEKGSWMKGKGEKGGGG